MKSCSTNCHIQIEFHHELHLKHKTLWNEWNELLGKNTGNWVVENRSVTDMATKQKFIFSIDYKSGMKLIFNTYYSEETKQRFQWISSRHLTM